MLSMTAPLACITSFTALARAATTFKGNSLSPGHQVGDWEYQGCANDVPGWALTGASFTDDQMTIEKCQDYCKASNFLLTGVEYARECYCGKTLIGGSKFLPQQQQDCNMNCKGNEKQMCGGSSRVSVFSNTKFVGPGAAKSLSGSWRYESYYMEPMGGRALKHLVMANDGMTVDRCIQVCGDAGYGYAGLEFGRECWCSAKPQDDLEDASDPNCAMQCDMVCGGHSTISIYRNGNPKRDLSASSYIHSSTHGRMGRRTKVQRGPSISN
jgi:hypothetical protein